VDMRLPEFRGDARQRLLRRRLAAPTTSALSEQRGHVYALIKEFQQAVARPHGLNTAIRILKAILPCSGAYFAVLESPHCDEHRRILADIRETIDRCTALGANPTATELVHAVDSLVMNMRQADSAGANVLS
jgi:hypothetical protein